MQEGAFEEMETLWPYGGFKVRTFERKLGGGMLTLTMQSFLFEAKNTEMIGFDFPALRLIRLVDSGSLEVVYSIQGELRNAAFRVVYTFPDGTERDELPGEEDPYRMSLLRAITGGVVARFLADHSNARVEGLTKIPDEKFAERIKDLERNLTLFPDKKQYDDNVWWDDELKKRSLQAAESEPRIWDDPLRSRLFYTGTNPTMTVDNAFEKLDILQDDWVNGRLSPPQRAKSVAMDYRLGLRMSEMGYTDDQGGSPESWKASADKLLRFERTRFGVDILNLA
jgi:hypothetical protein